MAVCGGLLLLLVILLAGGLWYLASADYRTFAEQRLSAMLDRPVKIGSLVIHWTGPIKGEPLAIDLQDLHVANIAGGSTPDMATVKSMTAQLDMKALLRRQLVFRQLRIDTPVIVLERDADGRGNWETGKQTDSEPPKLSLDADPKPDAVTPSGRSDFPVLLDFLLADGEVSYRTFHGNVIRIGLKQVTIQADGEDQPVKITASGAYNDAEMSLQAVTGSFRDLHDINKPLPAELTVTRQAAKLRFKGAFIDPLNIDGADGLLHLDASRLSDILGIFHTDIGIDPSASLDAHLTRQGDLWQLADAKGDLGDNAFTGQFKILEGRHGGNDRIKLDTRFDELKLDKLLANAGKSRNKKAGNWRDVALQAPDKTTPYMVASLAATKLSYHSIAARDIAIDGNLAPGKIAIDTASLVLADISLRLTGSLEAVSGDDRLSAALQMKEAEFQSLARLLGSTTPSLSGKVSGGIDISLQGKTLGDAIKDNEGSAVVSMRNGQISRDLLEKASTDLRNIFRKGEGTAKVDCLLAVMHVRDGIGQLAPAQLRSTAATLNAAGRVDFHNQTLDLTLKSERNSTGFLALDLPVQVIGPWSQPRTGLLKNGGPSFPGANTDVLPPSLQGIAKASNCGK